MNQTRRRWIVPIVTAGLLFAAACGGSPSASEGSAEEPQSTDDSAGEELQEVSFLLNWTVGTDHAAYFVAREKGWYEEHGIDLDITFGKGSRDTAIGVAAGKYDIGLSDASSVIETAGQAPPLTMVGMVYALGPQTGWAKSDSGIEEPKDFEGKKIGTPSGDAQRVLFPALAEANDFDADSVTWVNLDPGAKVAALSSDSVDVVFDFENGQPNYDKALGEDGYNKILWRDFGVNLYGNALVASDDFVSENEELIRGFLDASYRGWAWTIENQEEAIQLLHDQVPELDIPTSTINMPIMLNLLSDPFYVEHGLGWMDEERMCETVETVQRFQDVEETPDCDSFYTNDYLPGIELPEVLHP